MRPWAPKPWRRWLVLPLVCVLAGAVSARLRPVFHLRKLGDRRRQQHRPQPNNFTPTRTTSPIPCCSAGVGRRSVYVSGQVRAYPDHRRAKYGAAVSHRARRTCRASWRMPTKRSSIALFIARSVHRRLSKGHRGDHVSLQSLMRLRSQHSRADARHAHCGHHFQWWMPPDRRIKVAKLKLCVDRAAAYRTDVELRTTVHPPTPIHHLAEVGA